MNQTQRLIVGIIGGISIAWFGWWFAGKLGGMADSTEFLVGIILAGVFEYFFWKSPKEQKTD